MQAQTTQQVQYTVRLMTPSVWLILASCLWPTFDNHRIYQLQPAETESAPNVVRLLSAATECPPKAPIYPHSVPKPKFCSVFVPPPRNTSTGIINVLGYKTTSGRNQPQHSSCDCKTPTNRSLCRLSDAFCFSAVRENSWVVTLEHR